MYFRKPKQSVSARPQDTNTDHCSLGGEAICSTVRKAERRSWSVVVSHQINFCRQAMANAPQDRLPICSYPPVIGKQAQKLCALSHSRLLSQSEHGSSPESFGCAMRNSSSPWMRVAGGGRGEGDDGSQVQRSTFEEASHCCCRIVVQVRLHPGNKET